MVLGGGLGGSRVVLGSSWGGDLSGLGVVLEGSWGVLEEFWGILGCLGVVLEEPLAGVLSGLRGSWEVLEGF